MTLKEFLKEKRALTKFRVNYRLHKSDGKKTRIEADKFITEYADKPNAIVSAFRWIFTPEGLIYWHDLDKEWVAEFNKK